MTPHPTLTIDCAAVTANWQALRGRFMGAECAAVVKADAYGLGMLPVSTALAEAGCHTFFVAHGEEALALRDALPDVRILVLHGVKQGEEFAFAGKRIIPVLNSPEQIARWTPIAAQHPHAVSALHVDTGMGRLGLTRGEYTTWRHAQPSGLADARVGLVMSHLTCAGEATHPMNAAQCEAFAWFTAQMPHIPASLCNSAGIFLPAPYHHHLARPGCALYGIAPQDGPANPMRHVAQWTAPILQIRTLEQAQSVGYGATITVPQGTRILTVETGYADGYLRTLSGHAWAYLGAHKLPLLGRVTMDMLCFDGSAVPASDLTSATHLTLLGDADGIRVDDLAAAAGTIGYEVFSRIGPRVRRVYGALE